MKKERKLTVVDMVKTFNVNDKVVITIKPYFRGMPAPRYNGRVGKVVERQGSAYIVEIKDGNRMKRLVISPVHLKEVAK